MSMNDPIADMLTRVRNAQRVGEKQVVMPSSKLKQAILKVMKDEGYIDDYQVTTNGHKSDLIVNLKYYNNRAVIENIQRISRASLRIYKKSTSIPVIRAGMGISIVSTSKGVMTGRQAKELKLGGEVLCMVE